MILLAIAVIGVGLGVISFRTAPADRDWGERLFPWLTPLPMLLAVVVPTVLALTRPTTTGRAPWADELLRSGLVLSAVLLLFAGVIASRRLSRGSSVGRDVAAGSILAGLPLLLVGAVGLLFALR